MDILGALFGGSKSKGSSKSTNRAFGQLQGQLSPAIEAGTGAVGQLGNALSGGFDQYLEDGGFDFALGEGMRGITGAGAAKGLLRSGSTSRALAGFADGLARQRYDNYLNQLGQLGQLGLGGAGVLAGAGQESTSTSRGKSQNGILTSLFSDRRTKTDIVQHAEIIPGLHLYTFRYRGKEMAPVAGFMADEVEKLFPEAIGEQFYAPLKIVAKTVDYEKVLHALRRMKETDEEAA